MNSPTSGPTGVPVVMGVFEDPRQAGAAIQELTALGSSQNEVALIEPGGGTDLGGLLADMGLSDGETRFYAREANSGRTLIIVQAGRNASAVRRAIVKHGGYDVESRGAELAHAEDAGVSGGTGPRPSDVTGRWEDVASRYEMLWQQHYGTTDATWEQMTPIYRYAWYAANETANRGRPWSEAEPTVRGDWTATNPAVDWDTVAGSIRDVWEDVAAEAATVAEGGRARNIPVAPERA